MPSIFSTQNLQTFLRRKNFRPPSRGPPGPAPGRPPGRGPRGPRSPPPPSGRELGAELPLLLPSLAATGAAVFVVSSAMFLLRAVQTACFLRAKAHVSKGSVTARLKSCPDTKPTTEHPLSRVGVLRLRRSPRRTCSLR